MLKRFAITLSFIAIVFSLLALCSSFPAFKYVNFDYLGFIVGILAILVTAVLGWQIFNFFSVEKRLKALEEFSERYEQTEKKNKRKLNKGT